MRRKVLRLWLQGLEKKGDGSSEHQYEANDAAFYNFTRPDTLVLAEKGRWQDDQEKPRPAAGVFVESPHLSPTPDLQSRGWQGYFSISLTDRD